MTAVANGVCDLTLPGKLVDHMGDFPQIHSCFEEIACCTFLDVWEVPSIFCPSCLIIVTKYILLAHIWLRQKYYTPKVQFD